MHRFVACLLDHAVIFRMDTAQQALAADVLSRCQPKQDVAGLREPGFVAVYEATVLTLDWSELFDMNSDVAALYIESLNEVAAVHASWVTVGMQARVPLGTGWFCTVSRSSP